MVEEGKKIDPEDDNNNNINDNIDNDSYELRAHCECHHCLQSFLFFRAFNDSSKQTKIPGI